MSTGRLNQAVSLNCFCSQKQRDSMCAQDREGTEQDKWGGTFVSRSRWMWIWCLVPPPLSVQAFGCIPARLCCKAKVNSTQVLFLLISVHFYFYRCRFLFLSVLVGAATLWHSNSRLAKTVTKLPLATSLNQQFRRARRRVISSAHLL